MVVNVQQGSKSTVYKTQRLTATVANKRRIAEVNLLAVLSWCENGAHQQVGLPAAKAYLGPRQRGCAN